MHNIAISLEYRFIVAFVLIKTVDIAARCLSPRLMRAIKLVELQYSFGNPMEK